MSTKAVSSTQSAHGGPAIEALVAQLEAMLKALLAAITALTPKQRQKTVKPRLAHGGIYQVVQAQALKYGVELSGASVSDMLASQKLEATLGSVEAIAAQVTRIAGDGRMAHSANAWTIATTIYHTLAALSSRHPELVTALAPVKQAMRVGKVGSKGRKGTAAKTEEHAEAERERAAEVAAKAVLHDAPANGVSGAVNGVASPLAH